MGGRRFFVEAEGSAGVANTDVEDRQLPIVSKYSDQSELHTAGGELLSLIGAIGQYKRQARGRSAV